LYKKKKQKNRKKDMVKDGEYETNEGPNNIIQQGSTPL